MLMFGIALAAMLVLVAVLLVAPRSQRGAATHDGVTDPANSTAAVPRIAARVNDLLPQTQCEQCTFPGCAPYADAIARGDAPINLCPPGGQATVNAIASLLGQPTTQVVSAPALPEPVVRIDESRCIGCALCIKACPVDAILGASKRMHTVIEAECTGCELCIAPCPVDCIDLVARSTPRRRAVQRPA